MEKNSMAKMSFNLQSYTSNFIHFYWHAEKFIVFPNHLAPSKQLWLNIVTNVIAV